MAMLDDFTAMHQELLDVLGEPVTVTRGGVGPAPFMALVDEQVQEVGVHFQGYGEKHVVAMLRANWIPQRGDVVTARDFALKVEKIAADDGIVITVVLNG